MKKLDLLVSLSLILFITACESSGGSNSQTSKSNESIGNLAGDSDQDTPVESKTSTMSVIRAGHTATLLMDGRVLVAGGESSGTPPSAEIYDPATNTWSPTANAPSHRRYAGKAVRLHDGRVLIASGSYADNNGRSYSNLDIEIFDPATDTFAVAAQQHSTRAGASVTLLPSGKVLIIGGAAFNYATAQQEIFGGVEYFDPSDNTVTLNYMPLQTPRAAHTATLGLDGQRVYIAGGVISSGRSTEKIEILNLGWGGIAYTNNMLAPRFGQFDVSMSDQWSGRIYFLGGYDTDSHGYVFGKTNIEYSAFGGAVGSVAGLTLPPYGVTYHKLSDGRVIGCGGRTASNGVSLKSVFIFDPVALTWTAKSDLKVARTDATVTELLDGQILVAGGWGNNEGFASAEVFALDP